MSRLKSILENLEEEEVYIYIYTRSSCALRAHSDRRGPVGHAPWIRTRKRNRWMRRIRRQIKIHKTRKEGGGDAGSGPPETQKNGRNGGLGTHRYRRTVQRNPWSSKSKGREAFGHSHGVQGTPQKEKEKAKGGHILWNSSAEPGTVGGIQTIGRTAQ